jgi:hypothetical protein
VFALVVVCYSFCCVFLSLHSRDEWGLMPIGRLALVCCDWIGCDVLLRTFRVDLFVP